MSRAARSRGPVRPSRGRCSHRARRGVVRSRAAPPPRSAPASPAMRSAWSSTANAFSRGSRRSGASSSPRSTPTRPRRWRRCAPGCFPSSTRGSTARRRASSSSRRTHRVHLLARTRDDDLDLLAEATAVIGVGQGVAPEDYPLLQPFQDALGAELAATRKVTDRGWLPRARQLGITGRSIAPRLYVALGASGKYNHMVGVRAALLGARGQHGSGCAGVRCRGRRHRRRLA